MGQLLVANAPCVAFEFVILFIIKHQSSAFRGWSKYIWRTIASNQASRRVQSATSQHQYTDRAGETRSYYITRFWEVIQNISLPKWFPNPPQNDRNSQILNTKSQTRDTDLYDRLLWRRVVMFSHVANPTSIEPRLPRVTDDTTCLRSRLYIRQPTGSCMSFGQTNNRAMYTNVNVNWNFLTKYITRVSCNGDFYLFGTLRMTMGALFTHPVGEFDLVVSNTGWYK